MKVLELNNFTSHLDIRKIQTLWYGNRHFEAAKVMIFPYGGNAILVNNFAADLDQGQHDQLTDFNLSNHVEAISNGQFKIGQLHVALALKDMNTTLLENFAHVFLYDSNFQRFKLYSLLIDLFAKGMTVDLRQLQFNTEDGPVTLQAQINSPLTGAGQFRAFASVRKSEYPGYRQCSSGMVEKKSDRVLSNQTNRKSGIEGQSGKHRSGIYRSLVVASFADVLKADR